MISGPSTESLWDLLPILTILWPYSGHTLACIGPSVKHWPARPDIKVCDLIDIQGLFGTCCLISEVVAKFRTICEGGLTDERSDPK